MKAKPLLLRNGQYLDCSVEQATHIRIRMPGPSGYCCLPIITRGARANSPCWTWNGDQNHPTLKPSILTRFDSGDPDDSYLCHSFVTDGRVEFLSDSTHEFANQTMDLLDVQ